MNLFKKVLLSLLLIIGLNSYSQQIKDRTEIAEDLILNFQYDSASAIIKESDKKYLKRIVEEKTNAGYTDLMLLNQRIINRYQTDFDALNHYFDSCIKFPINRKKINLDFVHLTIAHISNLRNNNQLDGATYLNKAVEDYILSFDTSNFSVKGIWAYTLINKLVLFQIEHDTINSVKYGRKIISIAESTKDTNLLIIGHFFDFDTYTQLRNIDKATFAAEEVDRLGNHRNEYSDYYYANLFHLIDLYQHTKQYKKANSLLIKLYNNPSTRLKSYELLSRGIRINHSKTSTIDSLLNLVRVNNVFEFRDKAIKETEGVLFDYDLFYLYSELSLLMEKSGGLKSANKLIRKGSEIRKKLYSEDLSKSLAKQKEVLIRKEKELEVVAEKKKTSIYAISAIVIGFFFIIVVFAFFRLKKQKSALIQKNLKIEKQNKIIEKRSHEKALLLKEVHHRVKNNFQIISSLLELQSKGIEDEKAQALAHEGRNRVKSMALIHQKLYQNDDLLIFFDEYIDNLIKEISAMYGSDKNIKITKDVPKVGFDIDTAIPLGLIVNELITNAFKYGMADAGSKINVSIKESVEGEFSLEVKDNGIGMPNNFDLKKTKSLGLRLVKSLSKQLHGSVSHMNNEGAVFTVIFKNSRLRGMTQ